MTASDPSNVIAAAVDRVRAGARDGVLVGEASRITQLRQLRRLLDEQQERLSGALAADLGKPPVESYATEIGFTINEIDHALDHLHEWMQPTTAKVPLPFRPRRHRSSANPSAWCS